MLQIPLSSLSDILSIRVALTRQVLQYQLAMASIHYVHLLWCSVLPHDVGLRISPSHCLKYECLAQEFLA